VSRAARRPRCSRWHGPGRSSNRSPCRSHNGWAQSGRRDLGRYGCLERATARVLARGAVAGLQFTPDALAGEGVDDSSMGESEAAGVLTAAAFRRTHRLANTEPDRLVSGIETIGATGCFGSRVPVSRQEPPAANRSFHEVAYGGWRAMISGAEASGRCSSRPARSSLRAAR